MSKATAQHPNAVPDAERSGDAACKPGSVRADHRAHHLSSDSASRGRRPSCSDTRTWSMYLDWSHPSRSSASSARTFRHVPSPEQGWAHSFLPCHRRGVANTKTVSSGFASPGLSVRLR